MKKWLATAALIVLFGSAQADEITLDIGRGIQMDRQRERDLEWQKHLDEEKHANEAASKSGDLSRLPSGAVIIRDPAPVPVERAAPAEPVMTYSEDAPPATPHHHGPIIWTIQRSPAWFGGSIR